MKWQEIEIFADGADLSKVSNLANDSRIKGFTTNPSLMRASGIKDYEYFAKQLSDLVPQKTLSLEVVSDEFDQMYFQAKKIASWAPNIFVKVPIVNTKGESSFELIRKLTMEGVKLNITAVLTQKRIENLMEFISCGTPSILSIFCGRIMDTGRSPLDIAMHARKEIDNLNVSCKLLWASTRELYNLFQAIEMKFDIITMSPELIQKLSLVEKDLEAYTIETVKQFLKDASESQLVI